MIISWNTTNDCNMYCDHCYRDAGVKADEELSTQEGKNLIDEIAKAGFKIMIFSGGEPLMRPDIVELVAYATSKGLRSVFGTNGTYIDLDMAKALKEAGAMGMGISLDSLDKEKHDRLRKYDNAWDEAVRGMENCRAVGLPFQIHTTVMDWNRHEVSALTDFAVEMGAVGHHTFFLVPTGRAVSIEEESLRAEEYEQILTEIMEKQKTVDIELKPTCAPQFMRIAKEMGLNLRYGRGCLAGTHYCIISPVGVVQPCAYLNISAGNVREKPFSEIWTDAPIFKELRTLDYKGGCASCKYKVACGGCRARAYYYHDQDFMAEEPWCLYHGRKGY
ncbi:putative heme d1 biosynthesis radical SAM protein NirJ2 [Heliorestis convoluta]|uniref:Putative heme d1 biosynthesis radical SAM protein NirJ2 n=1 Tax=Heliorestis convoluta TaxID=356322 RepID=A0A5Q2N3A1_9FIRM|nr:putative heme d1 biosynthesis radical SAM protein NirJ2 [Heliorestis convoluta]QGG47772.1 putative heme d1 biosynthesis radical SAM protein NirJ2 [Heliorestis convoluta]